MHKKVLLINPRKGWRPALGLLYLAAYLRKFGHTIKVCEFIDEVYFPHANTSLWHEIKTFSPDVIGLGIISWNRRVALEIIDRLHREHPNTTIICGGKDPTFKPEIYLASHVDYVVKGEGEETIRALLNTLDNPTEIFGIRGLAFLRDGKPHDTGQREPMDVSTVPFPAFDLVNYDHYCDIRLGGIPGHFIRTGFIMATRGCPYKCRFCTDPIRSIYRERPLDDIIAEIRWQMTTWKIDGLVFLDDLFYHDEKKVVEFCQRILAEKIHLKLYAQTRVDRVGSEETLQLMKQAGFIQIALGVETGSQRLLDIINKGTKLHQIRTAIERINKAGICTYAFLIIGFPEETRDDLEATIQFLQESRPTFVAVNFFMPMPGTAYYRQEDEQILNELSFSLTENQQQFRSPVPAADLLSYRDRLTALAEKNANLHLLRYPSFVIWTMKVILFRPDVLLRGIRLQWQRGIYVSYFDAIRTAMINHRIFGI